MSAGRFKICIEVSEETTELLEVLASSDAIAAAPEETREARVIDVLEHLARSAAAGVRRPGSWERSWVGQAFGEGWEDKLETDPTADWRRRPRAARGES